jgi:hypothetical protein
MVSTVGDLKQENLLLYVPMNILDGGKARYAAGPLVKRAAAIGKWL